MGSIDAAPSRRRDLSGLLRSLLALPTIAWVLAFFAVPLGMVIVYSFATISLVTFDISFGWTLANYRQIDDPLYLHTLVRSVLLSVSTTIGCLLLGFPLAFFISRQPPRWQRLLLVLVIVPFWTSFIVRTYAIVNLLQDNGPLNDALNGLGITHGSLGLLYTPRSIAIGIVYSYLPLMVLPIYVSLERIDPALLDAAADLGASGRRVFRRVVLPLARPGIVVGCIIVGIPAMGEYVIPEILGGGKTLMLGNVITDQYLSVGDIPFGSAIAVVLMVVMAAVLLASRRGGALEPG
ncbi:MAG TPA: ABC transporter permease [Gaiellales bacterium]|jgi:spermidine/putrescine transport system permease protein|nr:ABC transporter permease [Gaiellales bacterium]